MNLPSNPPQAAYQRDMSQIVEIANRLIARAEDIAAITQTIETKPIINGKPVCASEKLAELKTIHSQMDKLFAQAREAKQRYHAAADKEHEKMVNEYEGLCSYAESSGQGSAATRYLLSEIQEFRAAKGDHERRKALWARFVDTTGSVVDAVAGQKTSFSVLDEYEAIQDPEASSKFYRENSQAILAAQQARLDGNI
jgi:hypothetical protein